MLKNGWHIVSGKWKVDELSFTHEENLDESFPDSLLINKEKLIDGEIKADILFNSFKNPPDGPHTAAIVFRYQSPHNYYFAGIGGYGKKFVIGKRIPQGSYAINTFGLAKEIKDTTTHNISLKVLGRKFSLFLNGANGKTIKILDAVDTIEPFYDGGNIGIKVYDNEDVTIKNFSFNVKKPKCFVVTPFNDKKLQKLKIVKIICDAAESNDLSAFLANQIYDTRAIITDIIESIDTSLVIIAEITEDNANVFYEVGIAHAKNSNVILICNKKRRKKLPFDIGHLRCIFYNSKQFNKDKLKKEIDLTIKSILERTTRFTQQESIFNFRP